MSTTARSLSKFSRFPVRSATCIWKSSRRYRRLPERYEHRLISVDNLLTISPPFRSSDHWSTENPSQEKFPGTRAHSQQSLLNTPSPFLLTRRSQIKATAMILSSFEEILYLDSDNIPLRDPAFLFDASLYSGPSQPRAVFWPDMVKDHRAYPLGWSALSRRRRPSISTQPDTFSIPYNSSAHNPIWRLLGRNCDQSQWEFETGKPAAPHSYPLLIRPVADQRRNGPN